MEYFKLIDIRWSDLDPNFHLRHSAYYDFGAYCRVAFMSQNGLGPDVLLANNIGPILFREECVFKRELHFGDRVKINLQVTKTTPDFSRWTMIHEIWKNDIILAAIITVDGAWLDTGKRKLTVPPIDFKLVFDTVLTTGIM